MYLANIDDYSIFINEVNMYKNNQGLAEHVTVNKTTLNCQMKNSDCGMSTHIILYGIHMAALGSHHGYMYPMITGTHSHDGARLTSWVIIYP